MTDAANDATQEQTSTSSEAASGSSAPSPVAASSSGASRPEAPARPEGLPDQFWDDKAGVKLPDLLGQFNELAAWRASEESRRAAVPDAPDKYEFKVPPDLKLPDGVKLNPDDPLVAIGRQVAHEAGLDQPGFEKLVGVYVQQQLAEAQEIEAAKARQLEALGPKAAERQGSVKTFLAAKLGPEGAAMFEPVLMLKSGVEAMERLVRLASNGGMPAFNQNGRAEAEKGISAEEWNRLSPTDRLVAGMHIADRKPASRARA
jgi:hypothetical protein